MGRETIIDYEIIEYIEFSRESLESWRSYGRGSSGSQWVDVQANLG